MSYDHGKVNMDAMTAATAVQVVSGTGIIARFFPGLRKFRVRRAGVTVTVAATVTPPVIAVKHRPTPGSASGEVTIDTITIPLATPIGGVVYVEDLDYTVPPGDEIAFDVTTAASAGTVQCHIEGENIWEVPANNSNMVLSA